MTVRHNISANLDNVTDTLSIVVVPCRYNDGRRGKGGQLSQSLVRLWLWRQGGQLSLPLVGCCFVTGNRDSGTDSQATASLWCRNNGGRGGEGGQLSLSLAGPM